MTEWSIRSRWCAPTLAVPALERATGRKNRSAAQTKPDDQDTPSVGTARSRPWSTQARSLQSARTAMSRRAFGMVDIPRIHLAPIPMTFMAGFYRHKCVVGATETVGSPEALQCVLSVVQKVVPRSQVEARRAMTAGTRTCAFSLVWMQTLCGGFSTYVIESTSMPMLLGIKVLRAMQTTVDFGNNTMAYR